VDLVLLAADYPFLGIFWSMLIFFVWVSWFWLVISVSVDIFRRRDMGGGKKTLWLFFVLFVPLIGVFTYLLTSSDSMAKRALERADARGGAEVDGYARSSANGSSVAAEINRGKQLLDSGAITPTEFDALKAKALA
jgi:hypothetical protein